jgi:hypothetical protein
MYTNELLEEKYKAQKELEEKAEELSLDYAALIEKEVKDLFDKRNWKFSFTNINLTEVKAA